MTSSTSAGASAARVTASSRTRPPHRVARMLMALTAERTAPRALPEAYLFGQRLGAELHLIRVLPPISSRVRPGEVQPVPNDITRALHQAQRALAATRHTRKLCDRLLPECLPSARICVRPGSFVDQVAQRASEVGAQLLVVPRGTPRLASTVTELARRTHCAVLVPKSCASFSTLLAATDLEDADTPVLRRAAQIGLELGATVLALHSVIAASAEGSTLEWKRLRLERATQSCEGFVQPIVSRAFDPVRAILKHARARGAGLIVVGTRARPGRALPNTAARLLKRARHSILVAPLRAPASSIDALPSAPAGLDPP
jgi:nucleotide-binding universal stress UspA family protein